MVNAITELFSEFGSHDYIGENITQGEHALQAAKLAELDGHDPEVVIACFLHDIGHLVGLANESTNTMASYGEYDHENVGANWLAGLGWPETVTDLVRNHIQAKRYLVFENAKYLDTLSAASRETFLFQGGPMDETEAKKFLKHPRAFLYIAMRKIDDAAKVSDFYEDEEDMVAAWKHIRHTMLNYLATQGIYDAPSEGEIKLISAEEERRIREEWRLLPWAEKQSYLNRALNKYEEENPDYDFERRGNEDIFSQLFWDLRQTQLLMDAFGDCQCYRNKVPEITWKLDKSCSEIKAEKKQEDENEIEDEIEEQVEEKEEEAVE